MAKPAADSGSTVAACDGIIPEESQFYKISDAPCAPMSLDYSFEDNKLEP